MSDLEVLSREAEEVVRSIGVPPCPAILTRLVREMRNDDPDFGKLGELIGSDVSLAAAILKTVNSPFYGLRTKATSIRHALTLLGLRNVTHLLTGLLLRQAFAVGADARMEEFWHYSSGVAQLTAALGRRVRGIDHDLAYTFALFRDCGMPAMMGGFTDYKPSYATADLPGGRSPLEREEDSFGIHHAYMGAYLAREWLLPDTICGAVLRHHDYAALAEGSGDITLGCAKLIAVALVAEHVYARHTTGASCSEWASYGEHALECLGLSADGLEELEPELAALLEERSS